MKRGIFILSNLHAGGAEKVILHLLRNLDRAKFSVTLLVLQSEGELLAEVPEWIDLRVLNVRHTRNSFFKILRVLRTEKSDFVLSTLTHLNILLCIIGFVVPVKIVIRESNVLSQLISSKIQKLLYRILINRADLVIAQSEDMMIDLIKNFKCDKSRIVKIHNPVDINLIQDKCKEELPDKYRNKKFLLSVGRLSYQKGYDLLINTFAKLPHKDYYLFILGQGADELALKQLSLNLGVNDKVLFIGYDSNPYKYMAKADFFISSSRFEGFPNVVIEALACGCPVVANSYRGGINEILKDNDQLGIIIDITDVESFVSALNRLQRVDIISMKKHIREQYEVKSIVTKYQDVLQALNY